MGFWAKFLKLDRRWIFLGIALVTIIPLIKPLKLPIKPTPPVESLFNYIDTLGPESDPLYLVTDFDPATLPELMPMVQIVFRHCMARDIPVILHGGLYPQYVGMGKMAYDEVTADFPQKKKGEDYVFLGYIPGVTAVILGIGIDVKQVFEKDYFGTPLDSFPMLNDVKNYSDISMVIDFSGTASPESWLMYAQQRYGVNISAGVTAVSAPRYYIFLQSGQFVGLLGGMKGASEYEELMARKGYPTGRRSATIGMDSQSIAHLLIIFMIILGNIGYFIVRRGERQAGIERRKR